MNTNTSTTRPGSAVANCALSTGVLLALSFYSGWLSLLAWVALVPLGYIFSAQKLTLRCWAGNYLGGLIFHLWTLDWIRTLYGGFAFEGNYVPVWIVAGQLGALVFCLMIAAGRRLTLKSNLPLTFAIPLVWMGYEVIQGQILALLDQPAIQFLSLAQTQADNPLVSQVADLSGGITISFLVALVNGFIYDLYAAPAQLPMDRFSWKLAIRLVGVPVVLTGALTYGHFRTLQVSQDDGPRVCLMTQHDLPPLIDATRITIDGDSSAEVEAGDIDLFVWPELSYHHAIVDEGLSDSSKAALADYWPLAHGDIDRYRSRVAAYLTNAAQKLRGKLLVGCERLSAVGDEISIYNSLAYVDQNEGIVGTYDKVHRAPFREYVPTLWQWLPVAAPMQYVSNNPSAPFTLQTQQDSMLKFGCGLCYEVAFPNHFRRQVVEVDPDFFVVAGSEASDQTGALSTMLLRLAKLRAIETRRPIVRSAYLGYSGWVDSCGRFVSTFGREDQPSPRVVSSPRLDTRISPYVHWGNWLAPLCFGLLLAGLLKPTGERLLAMSQEMWSPDSLPRLSKQTPNARSGGFSLFELMAVIAIIATIAIMIVPRVTGAADAARQRADKMNIALLNSAVERWYLDKGVWPAANLNDIASDPNYLPEGIPLSPYDGKTYKLNTFTHRVSTAGGGK